VFAEAFPTVAGKDTTDECGIVNVNEGMLATIEEAFHLTNVVVDGKQGTDYRDFIFGPFPAVEKSHRRCEFKIKPFIFI